MLITGYNDPKDLLKFEIEQKKYEGFIIPAEAETLFKKLPETPAEKEIAKVYSVLKKAKKDPKFKYVQPNDLESIRKERPDVKKRLLKTKFTDKELLDRFHGAWTGRAAGCALGKPVESAGMKPGRAGIKAYLKDRGQWPLDFYFSLAPAKKETSGVTLNCHASCRENIKYMEPDDDIHYTLIALKVLEKFGRDFSWRSVAETWNASLPYSEICTAECQAILNYNIMTPRQAVWTAKKYCTSDFTSSYNNPFREWIGAQIRADGWGYACAGNPELAAEFAWRDAHWTHRANGIYGEMFIAAVTAAAFVTDDFDELVNAGLAEIPARSKLAEDIRWSLKTLPSCSGWEAFMLKLDKRFKGMSAVHTNNNCLICIMAMYFGKLDTAKTIEIAVMAGLDTDCNGATVGSITGIVSGYKKYSRKYASPLHDTIRPNVFGFQQITMSELAERQLAIWKKIIG